MQVCIRYWKEIGKYWTPERQVASKENSEKIMKKVEECLKTAGIIQAPLGGMDEKYLIELMDYYGVDYYSVQGVVDKTSFSGILVFTFLKFLPVLNIYTLCILAIACLSLDPVELPKGLLTRIPIYKEENDFMLWLYNNFTNIHEIQEFLTTVTKIFNANFVFADKIQENKKLIMKCRETFSKLLKLKNSEFRTKKIFPTLKTPEKKSSEKVFKCKMPIEGKSIKLQSPSMSKIQPVKQNLISFEKIYTIHKKEYHPELLETLVEEYRNYSGCPSPDTLSPRIFKSVRGIQTPSRHFKNLRLKTPHTVDRKETIKSDGRSASTNCIRRINRVKFRS